MKESVKAGAGNALQFGSAEPQENVLGKELEQVLSLFPQAFTPSIRRGEVTFISPSPHRMPAMGREECVSQFIEEFSVRGIKRDS